MDYEKKYFDAIERLKQWDKEHQNGYVVSDRDKFIFPELAESEDEKIRMWLYETLKAEIEQDPHPFSEEANMAKKGLAWLEKQGEQKPKKCMYSNDNYTDEDRKVLCDGCKEDCELKHKQWKPSKEQLQALRWVCNRTFIAQEPQKESVLEDLYEQLMAL